MSELDTLLERHSIEKFAFDQLNEIEKSRRQLFMRKEYAQKPWLFLSDCVRTLNQVSQDQAIQPYPNYLEYLHFLTDLWLRERFIACPKSRRMFCSWNFISLYLHDTIFRSGRFNAFVSKKEDDASDLVGRAEFIFNNIPSWRIPKALLPPIKNGKMSKQPPLLEFEGINSKLQGMPQGADQLRQFTLSGILGDECAFWEEAQAFYSASKPTLDGGGRMTLISSRSPGFFKKIVFDQLDSPDLTFREVAAGPVKKPLQGIEVWRNPRNKFVVVDLHYSADPNKRSEEWREGVKNALPIREWQMEFEKSWQTFDGKAVYADFNKSIHVKPGKGAPDLHIPLILGVDFGLTPSFVLTQPAGRRLKVLREFVETDGSIDKLGNIVYNYLFQHYLPWIHEDDMIQLWIDPAGFQKAQTDARTCAGILRGIFGPRVRIKPGPVNWEPRRKAVEDFLTKTYGEGPGLEISEDGCPVLIEGFAGGYRYADSATNIEPTLIRPLKNKYSHPHDALQYACFGATSFRTAYGIRAEIPVPNYGFQATHTKPITVKGERYGTGS